MATAFVLYVDATDVGPGLELLRRVCQPRSRSRPHITVRYPMRAVDANDLSLYRDAKISTIHIVGPDSFGLDTEREPTAKPVVFLRCESALLESLSYKPDFPDSVFHITVYDGPSLDLAGRIWSVMREFRWALDITMPPTALTRITIGDPGGRRPASEVVLSREAAELLRRLRGGAVSASDFGALDDDARIDLVREICTFLNSLHPQGHRDELLRPVQALRAARSASFQPMLWSEGDLHDHDQTTNGWSSRRLAGRSAGRSVGLFLTPPELAQDVVSAGLDALGDDLPIDFGDPAIGSGIFFAALMRQAKSGRVRSAIGIEVDPFRAEQTNAKWRDAPLQVETGNFFDAELEPNRSLVVANPPYVRYQRLDREESKKWQRHIEATLGLSVDGRADLYVYFLLMSHDWLAPGAVAAWLLPSEFLQVNYGKVLREYLSTRVELVRVHTYDPATSKFENARVSSSIVVFRNKPPDQRRSITLTIGGPLASPIERFRLTARELRALPKWTSPRLTNRKTARPIGITLGELFLIKRGIATGANARFVLTSDELKELDVPAEWVKPIIPKSRHLVSNIIEADGVGNPCVEPRLWLIDTDADMNDVRRRAARFATYLDGIELEFGNRRLLQSRHPFYKQESREPPLFFVGYMSRAKQRALRSRFFLNRSRAVILNNYFALYPREQLTALLQDGTIVDTAILDALAAIDEKEIVREGRLYVSGLAKIEPRELDRVMVLDLPAALVEVMAHRS